MFCPLRAPTVYNILLFRVLHALFSKINPSPIRAVKCFPESIQVVPSLENDFENQAKSDYPKFSLDKPSFPIFSPIPLIFLLLSILFQCFLFCNSILQEMERDLIKHYLVCTLIFGPFWLNVSTWVESAASCEHQLLRSSFQLFITRPSSLYKQENVYIVTRCSVNPHSRKASCKTLE